MGKFAEAIQVYAQHLASHTSAVINLAEAAQDLKRGVAEQNKVRSELAKAVEEFSTQKGGNNGKGRQGKTCRRSGKTD